MNIHCHFQAGFPGLNKEESGITGFDPRISRHRELCHKTLDMYLDLMAIRIQDDKEETFVEDGFQILTTIDRK